MPEYDSRTTDREGISILDISRVDVMIPLQTLFARLIAAVENLVLGRRALRDVQFAKYNVAPRLGKRAVHERLLRRLRKL